MATAYHPVGTIYMFINGNRIRSNRHYMFINGNRTPSSRHCMYINGNRKPSSGHYMFINRNHKPSSRHYMFINRNHKPSSRHYMFINRNHKPSSRHYMFINRNQILIHIRERFNYSMMEKLKVEYIFKSFTCDDYAVSILLWNILRLVEYTQRFSIICLTCN